MDVARGVVEKVYGAIKDSILSGEMEPGLILVERELTERFECSRTPVREALQRLSYEGYVAILPRRGYLITTPSVRDTAESYHLREILEAEAARLAAGRLTSDLVDELREWTQLDQEQGVVQMSNMRFHMLIAGASGSRRLADLIGRLMEEMNRMVELDPGMHDSSYGGEHREIAIALVSGAGDAARDAMVRHIRASRDRVMKRV